MQSNGGSQSPSISQSDCDSSEGSDCTLVITTSPHLLSAARKRIPTPHPSVPPCIDLTGEEFILDSFEPTSFPLSPTSKEDLLRCETATRLCVGFFKRVGMEMKPMLRTDGKRRFSRIEIERGEYVFEEGIDDSLYGRDVASLKAVQKFNPDLVHTWLRKYKKVKEVLKGRILWKKEESRFAK
jgi:hypothetical protein